MGIGLPIVHAVRCGQPGCARADAKIPKDGCASGVVFTIHLKPWRMTGSQGTAVQGCITDTVRPCFQGRGGVFPWRAMSPRRPAPKNAPMTALRPARNRAHDSGRGRPRSGAQGSGPTARPGRSHAESDRRSDARAGQPSGSGGRSRPACRKDYQSEESRVKRSPCLQW